jgi:transposase
MEVHRRYRRAKTDRLDGHKLLTMLLRYAAGERQVWSEVGVPSVEDDDRRHLHRALLTAKRARTRVSKRMKGLLAGYGVRMALHGDVEAQLEQVHQEDGSLVPPALLARLKRAWQQGCFLTAQSTGLEGERRAARRTRQEPVMEKGRHLSTLRGIGGHSAWLCVLECCAWRDLQTPKHVGA